MKTYLYTADQVRQIDQLVINEYGVPGLVLMRRAAEATIEVALARWPKLTRVAVYCGSGNNAGDGYIVAGLLANRGITVKVVTVGDVTKLGADAGAALDFCRASEAEIVDYHAVSDVELVVDALLGTGINGLVRESYGKAIESINDSGKPVLSVDIPSGLAVDSGEVLGSAVRASVTVTFIARKRGLYTGRGPAFTGKIEYANLDVPPNAIHPTNIQLLDVERCIIEIPPREPDAHKTKFGHVLVVGGDLGMGGAVIMAADAALRSGAGLVSVATRQENATALLSRRPEVMVKGVSGGSDLQRMIARATHIVLGPGLGSGDWSRWLFKEVMLAGKPGVMDADALNILAERPQATDGWVLTPHPGEASRLLEGDDSLDRFSTLNTIQQRYCGVVLLKGAGTLITDGSLTSLCPYGNPGMASAGMGDVLSGIIGGLLAQGMTPYAAAQTGVVLHAYAADRLASELGQRGLLATDIIPVVRELVR